MARVAVSTCRLYFEIRLAAAFAAEILSLTGTNQKVISGDWALNIGGNKTKQKYLLFMVIIGSASYLYGETP